MPAAPVLFLDVDGVLNRTCYRPATSHGLRSWIEPPPAANLTRVLAATGATIVLSSDWRLGRTLATLHMELGAAGITAELRGVTPTLEGEPRWREIEAWMGAHGAARSEIAIVDDLFTMGDLDDRFVRTTPLAGLDDAAATKLIALLTPSRRAD